MHIPHHHRSVLSWPRWCSLGFTYSAPGPRWGLLSPRPPGLSPLVNYWLHTCCTGCAIGRAVDSRFIGGGSESCLGTVVHDARCESGDLGQATHWLRITDLYHLWAQDRAVLDENIVGPKS